MRGERIFVGLRIRLLRRNITSSDDGNSGGGDGEGIRLGVERPAAVGVVGSAVVHGGSSGSVGWMTLLPSANWPGMWSASLCGDTSAGLWLGTSSLSELSRVPGSILRR